MKILQSSRLYMAAILALVISAFLIHDTCLASEAGKQFNEADAAMNVAYKAVLSHITAPEEKALFVESQRAWLKYRDTDVAHFAMRYPESKGGLFLNTKLVNLRTAYLKSLVATPPSVEAGGPADCQE